MSLTSPKQSLKHHESSPHNIRTKYVNLRTPLRRERRVLFAELSSQGGRSNSNATVVSHYCRRIPHHSCSFMRSPELMTTMRRPRRLFKNRKPTSHDKCISLEHIPRNLKTANIDHRMCETIGRTRFVWISSRAVNTRFVVKVDDKIIQYKITHIIVVHPIINPTHDQTCHHMSSNVQ